MREDVERTKSAMAMANEKFTYPGVIYVEHPNGNIAPIVVVEREGEYTEYLWGDQRTYETNRHDYINSALKLAPNSQSVAKLFVINNATEEDIERVLMQAQKNVKPPRPK